MSEEARFGILLSLQDDDFESDLKLAAAMTKAIAKQMKQDTSIKLDFTSEDLGSHFVVLRTRLAEVNEEIANTKDPEQLKSLNKEAEELNETIQFITENYKRFLAEGEKTPKKITLNLKASVKQVTRLALGLVGIRGIWSALSRASNAYMNDQKVINQQLKLTFNLLGQMIGPIIKTLVNMVEYAVIVIAKLVQIMTGYDAITKANAQALKNLAKEAKKAHNALASFDTISNMTDNTDALEDYKAMLDAYNDFLNKQKEVDTIFEKWGKDIDNFLIALSAIWGAKTLIGLGKLIGTAGTATKVGTGLAGVKTLLGSLATFTALTITIYMVIQGYKQVKEIKEWLDMMSTDKIWKKISKGRKDIKTIKGLTNTIAVNTKNTKELIRSTRDPLYVLLGLDKEINDYLIQWALNADDYLTVSDSILKKHELTNDEANKLYDAYGDVYDQLSDILKSSTLSKDEQAKIRDIMGQYYDKLVLINEEYGTSHDKLDKVKQDLDYIDKYKFGKKDIEINATLKMDVKPEVKVKQAAEDYLTEFQKQVNKGLAKPSITNEGFVFGGISPVKAYDVGTNYVPNDQLAIVHKGEMIIPAKYNPMTSGVGGSNEETNALLRQLNTTLESKQFNGYISASDITNTAINGINEQSRIMGRSVIK